MKIIFIVLLSLIFSEVYASDKPQSMELDCGGAKKESVTVIPEPFKDIFSVYCTIYGHIITGKEGIMITYPGGLYPVVIPAQMVQAEPDEVNHEMYFTSISGETLHGKQAQDIYSKSGNGFDISDAKVPNDVMELIAINNQNVEQKVYLFDAGEGAIWGYACQPTCKPELSFMVLDMRK